jgi:3-phosphoshikimate 1-carboxyvinyltransferase
VSSGRLRIQGGHPLRGRARVPIDLEVAQISLVLAALAQGRSELPLLPADSDAAQLLDVLGALGVRSERASDALVIDGAGLSGLRMPPSALDCGSSWIGMALTAGLLSGQQFGTRVTVHASLATRSVDQIVGPLRVRGAQIAARSGNRGELVPPLAVAPLVAGESLRAIDCTFVRADSAAKAALLVSSLYARGPTTLAEPSVSADHTERQFVGLGLPLRRIGSVIAFDRDSWDGVVPVQRNRELPGSATLAAYLTTAAQLVPGSEIALENAGINPSRAGVLDILRSWGADVAVQPAGDASLREPIGEVELRTRGLRGGVLGAEELVRSRDEIVALAVLGAASQRGVQLFDLQAVAASDDPFWARARGLLAAFGIRTELGDDSLRVAPAQRLAPATYDAHDSAELALAATALGLAAPGETVLEHAIDALVRTYPGFIEAANALGARIQPA